ncbi:MAG TPA: transporter [Algoriphagus sp.]|jgi:outer membrane protein|uniref:TolC family protein n=3 Tax=Algoriphagus TaxID=246875 RepID=UPI000C5E61F4|nr:MULTISPECIES: TolC family protein [unclassified Algoriphagus]MAL13578.1 transporter [Algoriphagus sp.]MAN86244.1 transporter [Algoriphagus sp.]QYH38316.1 TolC family protein [Algoriphagus sp. NBT04N3]HAD51703.1 transporter [Algoriphagus sp.]HCD88772.1 transporter [Algoriphagus sp.]|tara:strand:+ start:352 stop:1695 length:1344 start_codon:yes stop_codon:yes gene_type:complete
MKKFILSIIWVIGCYFSAMSQDVSGAYDLETAVQIALENNLSLKRSELNQLSNEATLLQNKGSRYPSFQTGASSGYRWGRSINPVTNLFETQRIGNINLFANSNVSIFAGGRINSSINQAQADIEAGLYNIEATKNDITLNVINLFVNVVFNREQVNIAENQLKTTKDQLARTTRLVEAGSLPLSDQLDLQAQNATNELEVINAKNSLRIAKLNLAQAMQIPFTDEFEVIEPKFEINESLMATENPSQIYESALAIMPELKAAEKNIESAEYGVKAARGAFLPTLGIGANVFSNYVDRGIPGRELDAFTTQIENNLSQSVNLQLNIPIFSQLSNKASLQRARVQRQLAEVTEIEVKNQLRQDIESAYTSALAAQQSYSASVTRVKSLEESFRIAQQRFDLGAINSVDFQVAQANYFNAQADLLNAKYTYIFRVKVLDFYLGNPINLN